MYGTRTLKDRATTLQSEVEAALRPANKRRLRHCEAMDILARCDGHRNREAAVADERTPAPTPAATEPARALPSGENGTATHSFAAEVRFANGIGFLGRGTNGAPPDAIAGLRIECEYDPSETDDEGDSGYRLKALNAPGSARRDQDVLFTGAWTEMRHVLALVIDAQLGSQRSEDDQHLLAYRNSAQVEHDPGAGRDGIEARAVCYGSQGGFILSAGAPDRAFRGRIVGAPYARIEGNLGPAGTHELAALLTRVNEWRAERRAEAARPARAPGS